MVLKPDPAPGGTTPPDAMPADGTLVLGCDVGGTKVHSILATATGRVLAEFSEPTASHDAEALLAQIARHRDRLALGQARIAAAGIGLPGAVHPQSGVLTDAPHLPDLGDRDLRQCMAARLGLPVRIGNDVSLAALGEAWLGEGRGARSLAFLALGTGVGLGLIEDGRILRGARGAAGEIGDLPISGPGGATRLEDLVSSRALLADYRTRGGQTAGTLRDVFAAAGTDPVLPGLLDALAGRLALALRAVIALTDPERIVIGGGLGGRPEVFSRLAASLGPGPVLLPTALGPRAGALGAARLALGGGH